MSILFVFGVTVFVSVCTPSKQPLCRGLLYGTATGHCFTNERTCCVIITVVTTGVSKQTHGLAVTESHAWCHLIYVAIYDLQMAAGGKPRLTHAQYLRLITPSQEQSHNYIICYPLPWQQDKYRHDNRMFIRYNIFTVHAGYSGSIMHTHLHWEIPAVSVGSCCTAHRSTCKSYQEGYMHGVSMYVCTYTKWYQDHTQM